METKLIQINDRDTVLAFEITEGSATDTLALLLDVAGMIFNAGYTLPGIASIGSKTDFTAKMIGEEIEKVIEYFAMANSIDREAIFDKLAKLVTLRKNKAILTGSVAVGEIKSASALLSLYKGVLQYQARDFFPESHSESTTSGQQTVEDTLNM